MRRQLLRAGLFLLFSPPILRATSCSGPAPSVCPRLSDFGQAIFVGSVMSVERTSDGVSSDIFDHYRLRVEEKFAGLPTADTEEDLYTLPENSSSEYRFQVGASYLFNMHRSKDGDLIFETCAGYDHSLREATTLLSQLRAMRDGYRVASLYGTLRNRDMNFRLSDARAGVDIRISDGAHVYVSRTDANGGYSFYGLPAGKFRFSADLGSGASLDGYGLHSWEDAASDDSISIDLPAGACYEQNLEAVPTGTIVGRLLDAGGKPPKFERAR
jgi:hypothetical protein